jgi:MarR family transcriptional regulator, organic hydroperoxide resistance regulator
MLDALGITYPQYLVLHALWEEDGRTIGAIAQRLTLESSTVTPLVKRLEVAGLVERARNPADERQVQVRLSQRGHDMRDRCACLGDDLIAKSGMTMDELAMLRSQVETFRSRISNVAQPAVTS